MIVPMTAPVAADITRSIANFREAARHLWNCHYLPNLSQQNPWDVRDSFDRVSIELFNSLVLEPSGVNGTQLAAASEGNPQPITGLRVHPSADSGVPILINRHRPRSGYWDHPKSLLAAGEAELLLARFFDFDEIAYRDFRYLEVLIASSTSDPDIAGRWALLDFQYARVLVSEPAGS